MKDPAMKKGRRSRELHPQQIPRLGQMARKGGASRSERYCTRVQVCFEQINPPATQPRNARELPARSILPI